MNISIPIGAAIGFYSFYKYNMNYIESASYIIENEKIPKVFDDFIIVQISDLHNKDFGDDNEKIKSEIDEINPDIVVITGDLVDGSKNDYTTCLSLVRYISSKYLTYYIIGNHEQKSLMKKNNYKYKIYEEDLSKTNIINLDNKKISLHKDGKCINLYGVDIPFEYYTYLMSGKKDKKDRLKEGFMKDKLGIADRSTYNILLSHNPFFFEDYQKWGADLILTGHVHGGIIRLPFIGGLLSPKREFFPEYDLGVYDMNESNMLVSKGLGGSKLMMRVNCRPEIVKITLKHKDRGDLDV